MHIKLTRKGFKLIMDAIIYFLAIIDKVHLVDTNDQVRDLQQACNDGMTPCLFEYTLACVNQHQRYIGGTRAGDHVACVLDMSRCVRNNKLPLRCRKIPVRHIDGDPLFTLCFQSICEQGKVYAFFTPSLRDFFDSIVLILENGFTVVQESADEGRFAVVDRSCGCKPQKFDVLICRYKVLLFHMI